MRISLERQCRTTADGRVATLKLGNNLWETRDYRSPATPTVLKLGTSEGGAEKLELQYSFSVGTNNGNLLSHVIRQGSALMGPDLRV